MYTHAVQSLVFNRCCSFRLSTPNSPAIMLGDLVAAGTGDMEEDKGPGEVVEVTEANITRYSLADVVLPLPGKDVKYPANETGAEYKRVLEELGIQNAFQGSHVKELNLSGAYRKIVCMPQGNKQQTTTLFPALFFTPALFPPPPPPIYTSQISLRISFVTRTTTSLCSSQTLTSTFPPPRRLFPPVLMRSAETLIVCNKNRCWG